LLTLKILLEETEFKTQQQCCLFQPLYII